MNKYILCLVAVILLILGVLVGAAILGQHIKREPRNPIGLEAPMEIGPSLAELESKEIPREYRE